MTFAAAARRACALAARQLGWRPAEFWGSTPAELSTCLGLDDDGAAAAAGRGELERLMARFPDMAKG